MTTVAKPTLRILALSDARPGHFNKTHAVIRALGHHFEVTVDWLEIHLRVPTLRRPLAMILNHTRATRTFGNLFECCYRLGGAMASDTPDLIVSTGGNTLYANALLARRFARPNLFVGKLRSLNPQQFWRVIDHRPLEPAPPFLHWPTTLVNVDRSQLAAAAATLAPVIASGDGPLWVFLLGGDGGGFHYRDSDLEDIARCMGNSHRSQGVRWLVVSSRRTGAENEARLKSLLKPEWIVAACWAAEGGENLYHACLGAAERVVCTEDSHMMMTEAITAGKPVLSLRPQNGKATNQHFLPAYEKNGLVHRMTLADAADHGCEWPTHRESDFDPDLKSLGAHLADALTSTPMRT